ncbi:MAG TPA: PepSY-associated TM helix domain-containing protein [Parasegetibacter sp.]|jgi:uncharacterized iron-regulated membrane protein
MRKGSTPSRWEKIRKFFNDVHLWLGLGSGLIILVVCLSGTLYVFNTELTEWGAPHLYKVSVPAGKERIPADALVGKIKEVSGGNITSVSIFHDQERTYQFSVKKEGDKSRFGTTYMVDPYTGEIVGNSTEPNKVKDFMAKMFSLHRWLLLDKVEKPILSGISNRELGSMITGWATIIFTLGCITGLIIWFPKKIKTWRQGLKISMKGNWKRTNRDLHNTLAFYSLIFLLLMGLTGPQWSFQWYRTGLQKSLGTYKPADAPKEKPAKSKLPEGIAGNSEQEIVSTEAFKAGIAEYIATAEKVLSYKGNYNISLPADSFGTVTVTKTKIGFFAPAAGDRVILDQYSADVLKKELFGDKPFNERVAASIKALHVGNVYGTFTKILYFITCLIATSLPVTGTIIWLNKLKTKRHLKKKSSLKRNTPKLATAVAE